ncbi:hypothetical protein D8674_007877 [Pyrus ussuriensis x Pyrus communis]|uniref:Uncharacterized protein n=1 Tax=Pyrus ussuriensis x Pyrus communis TaxID=2448454 RepID=A0A5N5HS03_9ROSA|nr:hypothetical protein D8674_007877 [Pyrus ussuriensis x Pyrus communis]
MGFQDIVGGRLGCNYEKLAKSNEKVGRPERQQWVKKMNGRLKAYPTIIFSTQWGLPVLPHPSVRRCSIKYCSPNIVSIRNCIK